MKRFLPLLLSLAILCTMIVVPTVSVSASSFIDSLYLNADYTKETINDSKSGVAVLDYSGKDKMEYYTGDPISFAQASANATKTNPEGPSGKVAKFVGSGLCYDVDPTKVTKNFTCEVYFRTVSTGWGLVCGTYYDNSSSIYSGWGINMGNMALNGIGVAGNISVTEANGSSIRNSPALWKKARNNWTHVVYVNDGTNSSYYINGALVATEACYAPGGIPITTLESSVNAGFRVGSYRPTTDQFSLGSDAMPFEIAFARIYTSAATANDVTELFNARNSGELPSYTDEPTATPAITATPEITPAPSGEPGPGTDPSILDSLNEKIFFNVDYSTGVMDDQTGNYEYMDEISGYDPITFTDDPILNKKVLEINGDNYGTVTYENTEGYSFLGYNLTEGLTLETYVYLNTDPDEVKHNLGIIGVGYGYFGFSEYNDAEDFMACFVCGDGNSEANFNMGIAGDTTRIFPHKEWVHIVGTSDENVGTLYINGVKVAEYHRNSPLVGERYNTPSAQINLADSIYGTMWGDFHTEGYYSFARIYKACATDEQVEALFAQAQGLEPVPTEVPGEETPAPTPDVTPGPRPDVDVPTGDAYKVSFGDVPAFGAGDSVNVPLVISDITTESGIMGFDIVLNTNGALIDQNITDEDIQAANEGNESLSKLNGDKGKWSVSARTDAEGKLILTILDENAETVAKAGDEITINIPVKPTAAASEGEWVAVVTGADGTDGNVNTIEGSGAWALVTAPVATPTPEGPTEEPSQEPGEETPTPVPGEETPTPVPGEETPTAEPGEPTPTQAPSEPTPTKNPSPLNPSTFDPGILGLVAVSLSALVTTKRRKKED